VGQFSFSGGFGTTAWVDPGEDMIAVFISHAFPLAYQYDIFQVLAYQAITGTGQQPDQTSSENQIQQK